MNTLSNSLLSEWFEETLATNWWPEHLKCSSAGGHARPWKVETHQGIVDPSDITACPDSLVSRILTFIRSCSSGSMLALSYTYQSHVAASAACGGLENLRTFHGFGQSMNSIECAALLSQMCFVKNVVLSWWQLHFCWIVIYIFHVFTSICSSAVLINCLSRTCMIYLLFKV